MSRFSSQSSGTKDRGRRRSLAGMLLGVAALVVLPAAIAWACVPASSIGFDKPGYKYKAGDTVTVTGRGFRPDSPVVMKLQTPSGAQSTVGNATTKTDGSGGFSDSFGLGSDAAPGDYVVSVTVGTGGARETLTVEPASGGNLPPIITPPNNNNNTTPPPTPPTEGQTGPSDSSAKRARAIRACNKKFRNKRARGSAKRKVAKRRAACIRRAKKRYA